MAFLSESELRRFWSKVAPPDERGCRLWRGWLLDRRDPKRCYGMFLLRGREVRATRVMYTEVYGDPGSLDVLHHCDRPQCVEPAHLWAGTHHQNMADMVAKGRQPQGERHGSAKLSDAQVADARRAYSAGQESKSSLARKYGVSAREMSGVVRGEIWQHLSGSVDHENEKSRTCGETNGQSILTADDVLAMRRRYAAGGITQRELAAEYGVTASLVTLIIRGKRWAHITEGVRNVDGRGDRKTRGVNRHDQAVRARAGIA